ncbi:hypothetical protein BON22_2649 [Cyberlindnera fabianii]|uniref:Uncharacterized protein n=1 Tax=Cyberlindnera fabianii TaxID=36022 RepID=A0A1V2L6U4_CYBFA|nr:hypothetical protein BON22_2649 [Cyberlindnera fabianii]
MSEEQPADSFASLEPSTTTKPSSVGGQPAFIVKPQPAFLTTSDIIIAIVMIPYIAISASTVHCLLFTATNKYEIATTRWILHFTTKAVTIVSGLCFTAAPAVPMVVLLRKVLGYGYDEEVVDQTGDSTSGDSGEKSQDDTQPSWFILFMFLLIAGIIFFSVGIVTNTIKEYFDIWY